MQPANKDFSSMPTNSSQQSKPFHYRSVVLLGSVILLLIVSGIWATADSNPPAIPLETKAVYVGRTSCISCHQEENHLFLQSHHHQALAKATEETVLADFNNQTLSHDGNTSKFFKKDSKFFIQTEGPDGKQAKFQVKFVLAYHPLQQYMVELVPPKQPEERSDANEREVSKIAEISKNGIGQLQVLRTTWDVDKKKWYYLRPEDVPEKIDPTDPLHWTGVTQRWNTACAACHSTDLKKNFDLKTGKFGTTFSEIDVSCESCHGPGSIHVQIEETRNDHNDPNHGAGLFSFKNGTALDQINTCAPCHSRRRQLAEDFHETRQLHDVMVHEPLRPQTYYADGQIKDEVYVYGSFTQSKMFANGIRCTDCHNPHSGKTHYPGNRLCTSCHQHPAGVYDSSAHHGHSGSGPGTQCVDCHMPHRTYMGIDARRDHSIRLPRPDLSVKLKTPNACTGCHLEKKNVPEKIHKELARYQDWLTLREGGDQAVAKEIARADQWAASTVEQWRKRKGKDEYKKHFGEVLHPVWNLNRIDQSSQQISKAEEELMKIATGSADSPMHRMTATAELASFGSPKSLQVAMNLLNDSDPAVVFHSISRLDQEIQRRMEYLQYGASSTETISIIKELVEKLVPLLTAKTRLVRTRVASLVANLDPRIQANFLVGKIAKNYNNAVDELIKVYELNEQMGALGDLYQAIGKPTKAKELYRLLIKNRPYSFGARTSLAIVYEQEAQLAMQQWQANRSQMEPDKAREELNRVLEKRNGLIKKSTQLREQDGLLLDTDFQRGKDLPTSGPLHYRYAMRQILNGKTDLAGKHLKIACEKDPNTAIHWLGLATYHKAKKQWDQVITCCDHLIRLDPEHPAYRALLDEAKANRTADMKQNSETKKEVGDG